MKDLLEMLKMEDLRGKDRDMAEAIGLEGFKGLVRTYGGTSSLYVPKADNVVSPVRDTLIRREYNGENIYELARKWNLTDRYIQEIVKEKRKEIRARPVEGQTKLF